MLREETENPEVLRAIEKYGRGFEVIYFDAKAELKTELKTELKAELKADLVRKGLREGVDEESISLMTGFSIDQIKNIKRKL